MRPRSSGSLGRGPPAPRMSSMLQRPSKRLGACREVGWRGCAFGPVQSALHRLRGFCTTTHARARRTVVEWAGFVGVGRARGPLARERWPLAESRRGRHGGPPRVGSGCVDSKGLKVRGMVVCGEGPSGTEALHRAVASATMMRNYRSHPEGMHRPTQEGRFDVEISTVAKHAAGTAAAQTGHPFWRSNGLFHKFP